MEMPALEEMLEEPFARDGAVDVVLMLAVVDQAFGEKNDAAERSRDKRQLPVVADGLLRDPGERGEGSVEDRRASVTLFWIIRSARLTRAGFRL